MSRHHEDTCPKGPDGFNCRGIKTCIVGSKDYTRCVEYYKCPLGKIGDGCRIEFSPNPELARRNNTKDMDRKIEPEM